MTAKSETRPPSQPLIDLPESPRPGLRFLAADATQAQLLRAVQRNHLDWFLTSALASGESRVMRQGRVTWIGTPEEVVIAFPRMSAATAGTTLDEIVDDCRRCKPGQVACWSMIPTQPRDLGARLAARGFEWGWQPHWMGLDLRHMRVDFPLPEGLHIAVEEESDWEVDDLPYYHRKDAARLRVFAQTKPRRTWHFGAWLEGQIVGHSLLHLTTGAFGVAGIYNVGVVPAARNRGVGRAVSVAACQFAQALGCCYATLNAATHIYARIGFKTLGWGQTWWMHAPTLAAPLPTPVQIAFAEAVGRGDVRALAALDRRMLPEDLDAPLPCRMTPLALAVQAQKPASARWLVAEGATLDVLHAWDLDWKERIPSMLAQNPELVNRRSGAWQITPLHEAVSRGDTELARILLTAHPDLEIQDTQFHSTPLGWARHLQRTEILALLEQYQASYSPS